MENAFNKDTGIIVSKEFSEFVAAATIGERFPVVDREAKIVSVLHEKSGQTLFIIEFPAEIEDPNNDDFDPNDPKIIVSRTFPATVSMVQKMHKLWKKANADAPKNVIVGVKIVKSTPDVDEVINAASDDF